MSRAPVHLVYADALAKAREAFIAGKLQNQNPDHTKRGCTYSGPCAIGVSLSPEDQARFDSVPDSTISRLITTGRVTVPEGEKKAFTRLQLAHDNIHTDGARSHDERLAHLAEVLGLAPA